MKLLLSCVVSAFVVLILLYASASASQSLTTTSEEMTSSMQGTSVTSIKNIRTTTLRIVSNSTWRVTSTLTSGWQTVGFDDSSWESTVAPNPGACGILDCGYSGSDAQPMWSSVQY